MMFAKLNEDGTVIEKIGQLPETGVLPDGRAVSGFNKLDPETIAELGWVEVIDTPPPAYDVDIERLVDNGWIISEGSVVRSWSVETIPQAELDARAPFEAREMDARTGIDRIAELPNVRDKLRAVVNGSDTLTTAQIQRLVAALGLEALRNRDDV